jgi:hypothetical protein
VNLGSLDAFSEKDFPIRKHELAFNLRICSSVRRAGSFLGENLARPLQNLEVPMIRFTPIFPNHHRSNLTWVMSQGQPSHEPGTITSEFWASFAWNDANDILRERSGANSIWKFLVQHTTRLCSMTGRRLNPVSKTGDSAFFMFGQARHASFGLRKRFTSRVMVKWAFSTFGSSVSDCSNIESDSEFQAQFVM